MGSPYAVGIDLGTTNTAVGFVSMRRDEPGRSHAGGEEIERTHDGLALASLTGTLKVPARKRLS